MLIEEKEEEEEEALPKWWVQQWGWGDVAAVPLGGQFNFPVPLK